MNPYSNNFKIDIIGFPKCFPKCFASVSDLYKSIKVTHINELIKLKYIPNIYCDIRIENIHNKLNYPNFLLDNKYVAFAKFIEEIIIRYAIYKNKAGTMNSIDKYFNIINDKNSLYYLIDVIPNNITNIYEFINYITNNDYLNIIEKYFNEYSNILVDEVCYNEHYDIRGVIDIINDNFLIDIKVCKTIKKQYFIQIILYYILYAGKQSEIGIYDYYNGNILWIKTEYINKEKTLEYILNIYKSI